MKISYILPLCAASAALASPSKLMAAGNVERQNGDYKTSVYLCTDRNFEGTCQHIVSGYDCVNVPAELNDQLSSVGPDPDIWCYFYRDSDCRTASGYFFAGYPGVADLSVTPPDNGSEDGIANFEDSVSSYYCWIGSIDK